MKKTILIICRNNLSQAPRFLMEVNALKHHYNIIAGGSSSNSDAKNYEFIDLTQNIEHKNINFEFHHHYPLLLKKAVSFALKVLFFKSFYEQTHPYKILYAYNYKQLIKKDFDLIIAHHLTDLPLAVKLATSKNVKFIFNAHEYYPLEFEDNPEWVKHTLPKYMKLSKQYLPLASNMFCVCESISKKYKETFGIDGIVITNSKNYFELQPKPIGNKIRIIHHGAAIRSRKIELTIDMMEFVGENYSLDLMLTPVDSAYLNELKQLAGTKKNVNFIPTVNTEDIPVFINDYDIGLFLLPPVNFNYKYALPNKLFEFIQARVAIAVSPSPEMKKLVEQYDLGTVANDFSAKSMAEKIMALTTEKIMFYKLQCHKHAHELSSEKTEDLIKNAVDTLLNKN